MWQKIKGWCWEEQKRIPSWSDEKVYYRASAEVSEFLKIALKHYCSQCKQFFKTVAGAAVHRRLKHNP